MMDYGVAKSAFIDALLADSGAADENEDSPVEPGVRE